MSIKKLFAATMAATMVAGMSVSAFAYSFDADALPQYTQDNVSDTYSLSKELYKVTSDGIQKFNGKVLGTDTIFHPIMIAEDELDENEKTATVVANTMKANASARIKDLEKIIAEFTGLVNNADAVLALNDTMVADLDEADFTAIGGLKGLSENKVKASDGTTDIDLSTITFANKATILEDVSSNAKNKILTTNYMLAIKKLATENKTAFDKSLAEANVEMTKQNAEIQKADGILNNNNKYYFITKASEADGLSARLKIYTGKDFVYKDAKVGREKMPDGNYVYGVKVDVKEYRKPNSSELEYEITLKDKGHSYSFDSVFAEIGTDANKPAKGDGAVNRYKKGELTLSIDKNTQGVDLSEMSNGDKIERLFLEFDKGNFEVAVYEQEELWLEVNEKANKNIVQKFDGKDLKFVNFPGNPEFDAQGTLTLFVEDSDVKYYCYEVKDNKIVKDYTDTYNNEDEGFKIKTRTLGSYVISTEKLAVDNEVDNANPTIPIIKPSIVNQNISSQKPNTDKIVGTGALH